MPIKLPDRKYLLMIRDPLVQQLDEKHRQWRKNCFDEIVTMEVEQLKKKVQDKWNARLHWPETTLQGVTDYWLLMAPPYVAVKDERDNAKREEHLFVDKNGKLTFIKHKGIICCNSYEIPIIIDPTILTLNDARAVKTAVWDIVKSEIGKQKKTVKGRDFAIPAIEPEYLAAIFRCRSKTFAKYLQWYDFKEAGLSFRNIALIVFHSKPEDKEQKFEEHLRRKKKIRNIGPVKGESTIRVGYNLIYQAIFRTPAPTQEDHIHTSEKYNCPNHSWNSKDGWACKEDCDYLKRYYTDFENKHKEKPLRERLSPF